MMMRVGPILCSWCGHEYEALNQLTEMAHLNLCLPYQTLPVAEVKDGKEFVRHPIYDNFLIERLKAN